MQRVTSDLSSFPGLTAASIPSTIERPPRYGMDCRGQARHDDMQRAAVREVAAVMTATIPQERLRSLIHRHETVAAMLASGPVGRGLRPPVARVRRARPGGGEGARAERRGTRACRRRGADRRSRRPTARCARSPRTSGARWWSGSMRCAASSACSSSRATPPTTAAPSSKSGPAPAATRPASSPATSFACTSAMPRCTAGRSKCSRRAKARSAATAKSSPRCAAPASMRG